MKVDRVLTHHDLDGAACGVIAKLAWGCEVEYHGYETINEAVTHYLYETGENIVMADISPNAGILEKIYEGWERDTGVPKRIMIFDHHKSSAWGQNRTYLGVRGIFDETRCGAALLLEHAFKEERIYKSEIADSLQRYVEVVQTRDFWQTESQLWPQALAHHILMFHVGIENYVARRLRFPENLEQIHSTEMELVVEPALRKKERYVAGRKEVARRAVDKDGHVFYWVVARTESSQVGHVLCDLPDAEYALVLNLEESRVELRANGKVDVGAIARSRGGGGHPNASGYTLTNWDVWCEGLEEMINGW